MKQVSRLVALLSLAAAGGPGGLVAQVRGLPVRNAGIGAGIGIAADLGFPGADAGKGVALGATGQIGLGPLGVSASVATWDPGGSAERFSSAGVTGNLKIFGGPLIPISVTFQAGAAYSKETFQGIDDRVEAGHGLHPSIVSVGAGFGIRLP